MILIVFSDAEVKSETSSVTGGRGASFERDIAELEEHNTNTQHIGMFRRSLFFNQIF